MQNLRLVLLGTLLAMVAGLFPPAQIAAAAPPGSPVIRVSQAVSAEPLLGGTIGYRLTARNEGATPVIDKGYNLTLTQLLPAGLRFAAAEPAPTLVQPQAGGATLLTWENIADLEVREDLAITVTADLAGTLTVADTLAAVATAKANTAPDNSGAWVEAAHTLAARPQAIDLELAALPSTGVAQVGGAGEEPLAPGRGDGADWPFRYRATLRNNRVGASGAAQAVITLPPGVAYLGEPSVSLPGVAAEPALALRDDGSLELRWALGELSTDRYDDPLTIEFSAAVPYRLRTSADTAAAAGPFAGPMSGAPVPEDMALAAHYEAQATYSGLATADGSSSTPADDEPATLSVGYLTLSKAATPGTVGIGAEVSFTLRFFVSEYYTATNTIISDVLPDGMSYVEGSASRAPDELLAADPGPGRTTLRWRLPAELTTPGAEGQITFRAVVDPTYEAAPYAGEPIVSGDRLTNTAAIAGDWQGAADPLRAGATTPDEDEATVGTRLPTFSKQVLSPQTGAWGGFAAAFTGDTLTFRLRYSAADDVDAKPIVIRDFLPRGMRYVPGSAAHASSGSFSDSPGCTAAPAAPTIGELSGLQYLEWRLCATGRGASWEATIQATVSDIPDAQPGWIVANFGKLSGANTAGEAYSLRELATVDYAAPELTLTKTASPRTNLVGGSVVSYTISVTNGGRATAYNLVLTDLVPANLLVPAAGGTGSPSASSYTTVAGNPAAGQGGSIRWGQVASLAPGATQTFRYSATVVNGLPAGAQMTNLASVAYNSRADGRGHQWPATGAVADPQTDDETVYTRGVTVALSVSPTGATIGEVVRWTLTGSVAPGTIAYWPVAQINNLPDGMVYLPGNDSIAGATLDAANHPANPLSNGSREVRWFLQTIDNSAGGGYATFSISFDALVTGYKTGAPAQPLWDKCCLQTAQAGAYVGWYDSAAGYNGLGYAYDGLDVNKTTRRSGRASRNLTIQQPNLALAVQAADPQIGAGDTVTLLIQATNLGNSGAYDLSLANALPAGLSFVATTGMSIRYPPGYPAITTTLTDTNAAGAAEPSYGLDVLHVGATWSITLTAQVDPAIAAGLQLENVARMAAYSSRPGTPPDRNGDSLSDERGYSGPQAAAALRSAVPALAKSAALAGELTYGSQIVYTLLVPATPIDATIYDAQVSDPIDARLRVLEVTGASLSGASVAASFASIPPGEQRTITIRAELPTSSAARDGDTVSNQARLSYRHGAPVLSPTVAHTVVAPALTLLASADTIEARQGDPITWTLTLANVGRGAAQGLALKLTLPSQLPLRPGSARLNGAPMADPAGGLWRLPDLAGNTQHVITVVSEAGAVVAGAGYRLEAAATGADSRGAAIPADSSARVPADGDPDDLAQAAVYGPLTWQRDSSIVAYEDLKKNGWSDWDYNDFVVRIDIERGLDGAGQIAALRLGYTALARGAGFDHAFHHALPVAGGGVATIEQRSGAGALLARRTLAFGEVADFAIFERTLQALPPPGGSHYTNTPAAQRSAVAGYRASLTVLLDQPEANPSAYLPPLPWDPYIKVYNTGQEVHLVGPGRLNNTQLVNGAYDRSSPLVGYDLPLAQSFNVEWRWPTEFNGIWRAYPQYTGFVATGSNAAAWYLPRAADSRWIWGSGSAAIAERSGEAVESRYFGGPVAADLTGDGRPEIVVGNLLANRVEVYDASRRPLAGWPRAVGGGVKAAPAVADLTGDGAPEVIAGASDGKLYAWRASGAALPGWPVQLGDPDQPYRILATPAVADLTGDGTPELVVPLADSTLYALRADGSLLWTASLGAERDSFGSQVINSSPRIADLNGDGAPEVVVGSTDGKLYVFGADGSPRWSYQTGDMVLSTPAVADFAPGRAGLEIAFGSGDGYVYLLGADGSLRWRRVTGWTVRSSPLASDLTGDGTPELVIGADDARVYAWQGDGRLAPGWPQAVGGPVFAAPAVGDLDGDGRAEIVVGTDNAQLHAWHADGSGVADWPRATDAPVKGAPLVADLNGDGAPEVLAASLGGQLTAGIVQRIYLPLIAR